MSDGDRRDSLDPRLKSALKWAGIIAASFVVLALIQHGNYHNTASRNAANYAEAADDHIRETCFPLAARAERECTQIANDTARKNQREEYDLYSQKAMALWTAVMGGMAVVGVGLSVIGIYLIWQTFAETRKAARSSERAADAARDTHQAFINAERATLRPTFLAPIVEDNTVGIPMEIKNIGRSTGTVRSFHYGDWRGVAFSDGEIGFELFETHHIEAGESKRTEHPIIMTKTDWEKASYVGGFIEYESPFRRNHRTYFKVYYSDGKSRQEPPDRSHGWPEDT